MSDDSRELWCRHCRKPTRHELRWVRGSSNGASVVLRVWCCIKCGTPAGA